MKNILIILFFLLLSVLLTAVFFQNVDGQSFLFLHDQFLPFSAKENFSLFFTQSATNLGSINATIFLVNIYEHIYYFLAYSLVGNIGRIEAFLFFIQLFISLCLPYLGFSLLAKLYVKSTNSSNWINVAITLWYAFNTFTVIYWHGNGFTTSLLIAYALAPLAIYSIHTSIFTESTLTQKLSAVLLFFLISFSLFFAAVFAIFIIVYIILLYILSGINKKIILKNILSLSFLYIPLLFIQLCIPYELLISAAKTSNVVGGETNGSISGGFLYQLLMWFSWGIYTIWHPRNIFTFDWFFKSLPSLLAPFMIYGIVLYGFLKSKKNVFILTFIFLFLFFLFFIKGPQKPFGDVYTFLLNHFPLFRVFRSPDNKFSFGIILALSILLITVAKQLPQKIFICIIFIVILIQAFPLYTGIAVKGENTAQSSDRINYVPMEYKQAAEYINSHSSPYGYVLPLPSVDFGYYKIYGEKLFIGQDILKKITVLPFAYLEEGNSMLVDTYNKLFQAVKYSDQKSLNGFPIRFYVLRKDLGFRDDGIDHKKIILNYDKLLNKQFVKRLDNKNLTLYENTQAIPIISSKNIKITVINPSMYKIHFSNASPEQLLSFNESFNSNWKLYLNRYDVINNCRFPIKNSQYNVTECQRKYDAEGMFNLNFLWEPPVFEDTHKENNGYANVWKISPELIKKNYAANYYKLNKDGTIDFDLTLYFRTQSLFANTAAVSIIYLCLMIIYLLYALKFNKSKSGI